MPADRPYDDDVCRSVSLIARAEGGNRNLPPPALAATQQTAFVTSGVKAAAAASRDLFLLLRTRGRIPHTRASEGWR
jgi:hypothetical protein